MLCFEVWLLLHKRAGCPACNSCDELIRRPEFRSAFPEYSKGCCCNLTVKEIEAARKNARRLNEATLSAANRGVSSKSQLNPYTDMPALLDAIDAF